jgi:5'-nucleotidase
MKPVILCDMDEVVADLLGEWVHRYNQMYNDTLAREDITGWDMADFVKPECGKDIYKILRHDGLYDSVHPIPNAHWGIKALRSLGYRVVFVTTCVDETMDAKLRWLVQWRFLPRQYTQADFIAAKDKALIRGELLIDDGPHNIRDFPGQTILVHAPHNQDFNHPHRAHGWHDIVAMVQRLVRLPDDGT